MFKAVVIAPCSIDNQPVNAGDVVDVDKATLENLVKKGRLKEHVVKQPDVETVINRIPEVEERDPKPLQKRKRKKNHGPKE